MSPREISQGLEQWFTRNSNAELFDQDLLFIAGEIALAFGAMFAVAVVLGAALAAIAIAFQAIRGQRS